MKTCKKCLKSKPLNAFYRHPKMSDGHLNKCKECTKADVRDNYAENRDYYQQYDRRRYDAGEHYPSRSNDNHNEYSRRWYERNREKKRAEEAVRRAVNTGILVRPRSCEQCGRSGRAIEAHHHNYSKPLDVKWLCTVCHGETRKKSRRQMEARKVVGYQPPMQPTRAA